MNRLKAIDFFCGGGGMTCGLKQAGIDVLAGVDIDLACRATYERNNPGSRFLCEDVKELPENRFEELLGIVRHDDDMIFVGCSPCQFYSIINTSRTRSEQSKNLLMDFLRFVDYYRPGYVLVENVPGIRTKGDVLKNFTEALHDMGYDGMEQKVVDLSYYGVPQSRRRFSLIASRVHTNIALPEADGNRAVLKDHIGPDRGFPPVPAGHRDPTPFMHTAAGMSDKTLRRLHKTPADGGSRFAWQDDEELQLPCFVGKPDSFVDTFGRLAWDKPASTITTRFTSISNGRFAHPEEHRGLTLREGATLQTFPKDYVFVSESIMDTARMIGNAVPPEYARRLGETILQTIRNHEREKTENDFCPVYDRASGG